MPVTAGILVRISDDRTGDALGVDRQEADCRALAKRKGWAVSKVYRENDTSAFTRRQVRLADGTTALRVVRPAFRELLSDIVDGTITALVAYDLDRVARDPRDLEDLIDAVEQAKLPTAAVTGDVDLGTDNGVFMARMMVNVANKSSRDTSRRVRRAMVSVAEQGLPHGGAPAFGYDSEQQPVPVEAEAVRRIHQQIHAGRSLRSIARELVLEFPARRWDAEAVKRIATNPRYAGRRVHRGQVVGLGRWPALVDIDIWERTQTLLSDRQHPGRHVGGPRKYLLTGLLYCHRCDGVTLVPRRNADRQRFGCPPLDRGGCAASLVVYEPLEAMVIDAALARLANDLDPVDEPADDPSAMLRQQIAALEAEQADLGRQLAEEGVSLIMARAADKAITAKIEALRQQIRDSHQTRQVIDPKAVAAQWDDYDTDQQRAILQVLIERITIGPGARSGPRFDPRRVEVNWR